MPFDPIADATQALNNLDLVIVSEDDTARSEGLLLEVESEQTEWRSIKDKWYVVNMSASVFASGDEVEDFVLGKAHEARDAVEGMTNYLLHSSSINWEPPTENELRARVQWTLRYKD